MASTSKAIIPQLDTLRAIAVLLVLIFHLDPRLAPFGFVGVDIFFTLSGFLMTYIYLDKIDEELSSKIIAMEFLKKRFWRIAPSIILTVFVVIVISALFFSPDDLIKMANSGIYATLFIPNWLFYNQSGYFDVGAIYKTLLHTWSLGVEEQFYLFFAILLLLCKTSSFQKALFFFFAISILLWLLVATNLTFALDLNLSVLQPHAEPTTALFYLPHYRAFQFLVGSIAAIHILKFKKLHSIFEVLGIMLLILGFFIGSQTNISYLSVVPISLGVVLLMTESKILRFVGMFALTKYVARISYQLYLVHWPVIVFWHYITLRALNPTEILVCTVICFALAELLYRVTNQYRVR